MKITVTQKNINQGKRRVSGCCPVALALRDIKPDSEYISVGTTTFQVNNQSFHISEEVKKIICDFDIGGVMTPFSFEAEELK